MDESFGLPRDLGDGLRMRWATPADAERLAAFNIRVHSDNPEEPEEFVAHWTRDLMNGTHPTTRAEDFTVVEDTRKDNKIVSSMNLISQRWSYDGIAFCVGRPELVGTEPAYRRRGLVRAQMAAVHAKSDARGELVQAITGIPWYYRLFGYEMALNLGGGRRFIWSQPGNARPVEEENYAIRPASADDIPQLQQLYQAHCGQNLIVRVRDQSSWAYEMSITHRESPYARHVFMIETIHGDAVAYVEYRQWGQAFVVREFGVQAGHSWRAVALFLTRYLHSKASELNKERDKPINSIGFSLGEEHALYEALGRQLSKLRKPYAWYMRVPDIPQFLQHIAPSLERRLANSILAGHSGTVKLNFFKEQLTMVWENGKLVEIGTFTPERLGEGNALLPELIFLQLLFGYKSVRELEDAFADCHFEEEARILLNVIFPRRPSDVLPLG